MKQLKNSLFFLILVALVASCIKAEEVVTTPECGIYSFSVASITCPVPVKTANGKDSTVNRSLSSSEMRFNIDQLNGIITTVDSMPNWIALKSVTPSFSAYGTVYAKIEGSDQFRILTSGSDTINMTKPIKLISVASDGISTKEYTVSFKVCKDDIDTLSWKKTDDSNLSIGQEKKILCNGGNIYAFSYADNGNAQVTTTPTSGNGSVWTPQAQITGAEGIDIYSILIFKGDFYAIANDGKIYKSIAAEGGKTWTKACDESFVRLMAADGLNIYAFDGNEMKSSNDLATWTSCGNTDIDQLPEMCINTFSYESKTNHAIQIAMMTGISTKAKDHTVAWYKVTANDDEINQDWMYIQKSKANPYNMPAFDTMSVAYHKDQLIAIGTMMKDGAPTYKYIYFSADNGITWIPQTSKYMLPAELDAANGAACMVSDGDKLWLIQNGSNIWRGTIR